jgi:GNAT superfamily N-acetyltransferase
MAVFEEGGMSATRYRQFGPSEAEEVGRLFAAGFNDLLVQKGLKPYVDLNNQQAWTAAWKRDRRSLFEHLAATSAASWLVEDDKRLLGYARSIIRDRVGQLTEFFVLPDAQASGLGRGLLERSFDSLEVEHRAVIATTNAAAMARYLKSGVFPICPVLDFDRKPEPISIETDIGIEPISAQDDTLSVLNAIDREILGYERELDHRWLLRDRQGYLYLRKRKPIGYGYVGRWCGPFALREPEDFPAVLAHAESAMVGRGHDLVLMVPLVNRFAVEYVLWRGFQMNTDFVMLFLTDSLSPNLENYPFTLPGFFT